MTRRSWFATLGAAFAAAVARKPLCFPNHPVYPRKPARFDGGEGLTIRVIRQYDKNTGSFITRMDVLMHYHLRDVVNGEHEVAILV